MDCKNMQKSLIINCFQREKHSFPLKTARKSTNFNLSAIRFILFFKNIKIESD